MNYGIRTVLINKFHGSKARHSAASQHVLCLRWMGKSRPIYFHFCFLTEMPHRSPSTFTTRPGSFTQAAAVSQRYEIPLKTSIVGKPVLTVKNAMSKFTIFREEAKTIQLIN